MQLPVLLIFRAQNAPKRPCRPPPRFALKTKVAAASAFPAAFREVQKLAQSGEQLTRNVAVITAASPHGLGAELARVGHPLSSRLRARGSDLKFSTRKRRMVRWWFLPCKMLGLEGAQMAARRGAAEKFVEFVAKIGPGTREVGARRGPAGGVSRAPESPSHRSRAREKPARQRCSRGVPELGRRRGGSWGLGAVCARVRGEGRGSPGLSGVSDQSSIRVAAIGTGPNRGPRLRTVRSEILSLFYFFIISVLY